MLPGMVKGRRWPSSSFRSGALVGPSSILVSQPGTHST